MTPSPSPNAHTTFARQYLTTWHYQPVIYNGSVLSRPPPLAAPPCPPPTRVPDHTGLVGCPSSRPWSIVAAQLHILTRKNQIRLPSPSLPVLVHSNRNQRAPKPPNRRPAAPAITSSRCNARPFGSSPLHLRHALASPRLASSRVCLGLDNMIVPIPACKQHLSWAAWAMLGCPLTSFRSKSPIGIYDSQPGNSMGPAKPGTTQQSRQHRHTLPVGCRPSVLLGESRGQKVVQLEFACPTASNPIWEHG